MTTELHKLQIENPPKKNKNYGRELVHGKGLTKVACPEEVKGAGHAAAEAMMVKDKRKEARESNRTYVQAGNMGQGVSSRKRS